ncbi:MAG: hypothetical protein SGPRY_013044 [Prymnesium sp.]
MFLLTRGKRSYDVSLRQVVSIVGGVGVASVCSVFAMRQYQLRSSEIFHAAREQVMTASVVSELMGERVVSTRGVLGGYVLPYIGTAAITFPFETENGRRGIARVEAETEWMRLSEEERTREQVMNMNTRWQLRHLEVEAPRPPGSTGPLVLYSLPAHAPLSHWAPLRESEGSVLPRWLRDLVPVHGIREDKDALQLCGIFLLVTLLHTGAFLYSRSLDKGKAAMETAQKLLALNENVPGMPGIRIMAREAANTVERQHIVRASDGATVKYKVGDTFYGDLSDK